MGIRERGRKRRIGKGGENREWGEEKRDREGGGRIWNGGKNREEGGRIRMRRGFEGSV